MNLLRVLAHFGVTPKPDTIDRDLECITTDSRTVRSDMVFVAIKGTNNDGHDFLPQACAHRPEVVIVENKSRVPLSYSGFVIEVMDTRQTHVELSAEWFDHPSRAIKVIGVTGTNGKTSITYMVEHILNSNGIACGVIGTVNHHLRDLIWETEMTTPDAFLLQSRLREMRDLGAKAVVMEVSSHSLSQHRVDGVEFDVAIFTNLTRDHLDYHKSMVEYFRSKERLFLELLSSSRKSRPTAIINIDDEWGQKIHTPVNVERVLYGQGENANFQIADMDLNSQSAEFELRTQLGVLQVSLPMGGRHNVYNMAAALGAAQSIGLDLKLAVSAVSDFNGVPGRLERVRGGKDITLLVDYAHSPDALENVLKSLRELMDSGSELWVVFGCGGDRDKGKRPIMGKIACELADHVVVTSDNPRTEDAQLIIDEIIRDLADISKVTTLRDREEAIAHAIRESKRGDIVLIAGKGHEDYQIIGTEKRPFSDQQVAKKYLEE